MTTPKHCSSRRSFLKLGAFAASTSLLLSDPSHLLEEDPITLCDATAPNAHAVPTPLDVLHLPQTPLKDFLQMRQASVCHFKYRDHRLVVHGAIASPQVLDMNDLQSLPLSKVLCALHANQASPKGFAWASQGLFEGVYLKDLLSALCPDAFGVVAYGADGYVSKPMRLADIWDSALLAYRLGGNPLEVTQGYPLRLIVPGFTHEQNVLWLNRLEIVGKEVFGKADDYAQPWEQWGIWHMPQKGHYKGLVRTTNQLHPLTYTTAKTTHLLPLSQKPIAQWIPFAFTSQDLVHSVQIGNTKLSKQHS